MTEEHDLDDTSTLELITYALWLARDLLVPAALFLAVLGLFNRRDRRKAVEIWVLGLLATIATFAVDPANSLLNIPDGLIVIMVIVAGGLIAVASRRARRSGGFRIAGRASNGSQTLTYRQRSGLLTPAEKSFYQTLVKVAGEKAVICPKVGLWDIFDVEDAEQAFVPKSRIDRKHVDFLLCEPRSMQPLVAVELDDSSHNRPDRQERDRFVDEVFRSAELPLVHIRVQRTYDVDTLAERLSPYLNNGRGQEEPVGDVLPASVRVSAEGVPLCPKCGAPMIIRVAQRGQHKGDKFYACSTYPECRGILPIK